MIWYFLFTSCCIVFGMSLKSILLSLSYVDETCELCSLKVLYPRKCRWEYIHRCTHSSCETNITRIEPKDEIEPQQPPTGKVSGEGKTLC